MSHFTTKCLIIGSGPAGYTAAIYASRANLNPILVEGYQPGGQLTTTTEVENFPGYVEGVSGSALMDDLRAQAARYGAQIISGEVSLINLKERPFKANIDGSAHTVDADTVIICTGASAKYLGLPEEQKYMGMGVSACATCDGFFYRNRVVAVVGGGDTACEEALYLSNLAKKVYMIVRKDYLRASKVMQQRVLENPKIEVLFRTVTKQLFGEEVLEGATVTRTDANGTEDTFNINVDGFFMGIGHQPNTSFLRDQVELDPAGYIVTMPGSTATSVEGVFAAGDVADPVYKQAISAAGMGCRAALDAERYITLHKEA